MIITLSACAKQADEVPSVTYEDNEISVNGKYIATSETMAVNRIDAHVVSLISDSGFINLDAQGNEIRLDEVITDRDRYESSISDKVERLKTAPLTRDSVIDYECDYDAMLSALSSYDDAMKLPFYFADDSVCIVYKDENGHAGSVSYNFTDDHLNSAYKPGDGITCRRWMMGRLGYGIKGLMLDEYADHWVEDSLEIKNYEGQTYYWFCVAYEDDAENKTYYSAVARQDGDERTLICLNPVDGPFCCCDINEFSRILEEQ